jgi:hypothetical protein
VLGAGVLDGAFAPADADAGAAIFRQICWKQICRCQHWESAVHQCTDLVLNDRLTALKMIHFQG